MVVGKWVPENFQESGGEIASQTSQPEYLVARRAREQMVNVVVAEEVGREGAEVDATCATTRLEVQQTCLM